MRLPHGANRMPAVSVLMTARNASPTIAAALRSVLAADGDLEVVVVDDGSTDGTADAVRQLADPRIRLHVATPQGLGLAWNQALSLANAEFVARCDADDLFTPDRLGWQRAWLAEHPDFVAVAGSFAAIDPAGRPVPGLECRPDAADITAELRDGQTRTHLNAFLMRTAALRQIGGFRPWFRSAGDLDVQFRLATVGRVAYEPRLAYLYRLHDHSVTHSLARATRLFFEQSARQFAQQRRDSGLDDLAAGRPPEPPTATGPATDSAEHMQGLLLGAAWQAHRAGQRWQALRLGWRACRARPGHLAGWRSLLALLVKPAPPPAQEPGSCA